MQCLLCIEVIAVHGYAGGGVHACGRVARDVAHSAQFHAQITVPAVERAQNHPCN